MESWIQRVDAAKAYGGSVRYWRELRGVGLEALAAAADLECEHLAEAERGERFVDLHALDRAFTELGAPIPGGLLRHCWAVLQGEALRAMALALKDQDPLAPLSP